MPTSLHNLSDESMLQLYAAGELPAEQRAAIDARLAGDAVLSAQLDELRATENLARSAIDRLDAAQPLPVTQAAAVRRVSRVMNQWSVDRLIAENERNVRRPFKFGWRSYSAAAAVAILVGVSIWWAAAKDVDDLGPAQGSAQVDGSGTAVGGGGDPSGGFGWPGGGYQNMTLAEDAMTPGPRDEAGLSNTEQQMYALSYLSDSLGREEPVTR